MSLTQYALYLVSPGADLLTLAVQFCCYLHTALVQVQGALWLHQLHRKCLEQLPAQATIATAAEHSWQLELAMQ